MTGLFNRILRFFRRKTRRGLDASEDAALEESLKQAILEMESELNAVIQASADAAGHYEHLQAEVEKQKEQSAEWKQRAQEALRMGDEESAKKALLRKRTCDRQMESMAEDLKNAAEVNAQIQSRVDLTRSNILSAKRNVTALVARRNAAKAQKKAMQALAETSEGENAVEFIKRFEDSIAKDEAVAKAVARVYKDTMNTNNIVSQIAFEKSDDADVNAELAVLKAEIETETPT